MDYIFDCFVFQTFNLLRNLTWEATSLATKYFQHVKRKLAQVGPMFHFYTNLKLQKSKGFLIFSGGKEMEYWVKMG